MAQIDFFCDERWERVAGKTNSSILPIPNVCQNDVLSLRVWPLTTRTGGLAANPPYDFIDVTGTTLKLAIKKLGGTTYLASQFTWTKSTDLANPYYFFADLSFNTNEIDAALGSDESLTAKLQIQHIDGSGNPRTILRKDITIFAASIDTATLIPAPNETVLTREVADSIYLSRRITGPVYFINESDSSKINRVYTDTDGSFKESPE